MGLVFSVDISAIEDAMVAAIKADSALGSAIKRVDTFQGSWSSGIKQVGRGVLPAVLIVYGGGETEAFSHSERIHTARFHLFIYTRNLRSESARRAAGVEVGSYEIVQGLHRVLAGKGLGLDIEAIEPESVEPMELADAIGGLAVYEVRMTTRIVLEEAEAEAEDEADLDTLQGTYDDILKSTTDTSEGA